MNRTRALLFSYTLLGGLLLGSAVPVMADAHPPADQCPEVLFVDEVTRGMEGTGLTVSSGTTPDPFDVTVIDVLHDALAPGVPLIVVEVESVEIDRVGGIWAGMSGSPVYVDGKLLGAVAYGFSWGPSKLGGVTPATAMMDVPNRPSLAPGSGDDVAEIQMSPRVRNHAASEEGLTAQQSVSMQQLRVPVRVSGTAGAKFDRFKQEFERSHPGTAVVRSGGSTGSTVGTGDIVAGGNLGVSLAYGDFTAVGIGTVTAVCDGVVLGFGHPLIYDGATRLGMHTASAVRVVDDSVFGPYKLANTGPVSGTIDHDRLAAVAGRLGVLPPTTAITTTITNTDGGRTIAGRTDNVLPEFLPLATLVHGWNNYDLLVFDDLYYSGSADVSWTIAGTRRDGSPWTLTRGNRHADREDLSTASLIELVLSAQLIGDNDFEDVRITDIDYVATAGSDYNALTVVAGDLAVSVDGGPFLPAADGIELEPGSHLKIRVPLRPYRSTTSEQVQLELQVPDDATGWGELTVTGGGGDDDMECIWWPEECTGTATTSFAELLDLLAERPRADDLVATLRLYPDDFDWDDPDEWDDTGIARGTDDSSGPLKVSTSERMPHVVTGWAEAPAFVTTDPFEPGEPVEPSNRCADLGAEDLPFWDVDPKSVHAQAIACAFELGVTKGTSTQPPLYSPGRPVLRDQAASFVARLLAHGPRDLPARPQIRFTDLEGNVHRTAIEQLASAGIVQGRTATTFAPGLTVTRAQIATMLVEALRWSLDEPFEASGGHRFTDVGGVHARNIDVAAELGLVRGRPDGTYQPQHPTRRDQMASVLARTYSVVQPGG